MPPKSNIIILCNGYNLYIVTPAELRLFHQTNNTDLHRCLAPSSNKTDVLLIIKVKTWQCLKHQDNTEPFFLLFFASFTILFVPTRNLLSDLKSGAVSRVSFSPIISYLSWWQKKRSFKNTNFLHCTVLAFKSLKVDKTLLKG